MDKTRESNTANVSFVVGKCGKSLQGVDSFIFDPKDMDRTRFSCKTRGCNASITITENGSGESGSSGTETQPHKPRTGDTKYQPHPADSGRSQGRSKQVRNDKTAVSSVRNEPLA